MKKILLIVWLSFVTHELFSQTYLVSDTITINGIEYIIESLGTSGAAFDRITNQAPLYEPTQTPPNDCFRLTINEALVKSTIESTIPLPRRSTIKQFEKDLGMTICVSPSTGKIVEVSFAVRTYSVVIPQELAQIEVALLGKTVSPTYPFCSVMPFLQKRYRFEW